MKTKKTEIDWSKYIEPKKVVFVNYKGVTIAISVACSKK